MRDGRRRDPGWRNLGGRRIAFELKVWTVWLSIARERMAIASGLEVKGPAQRMDKTLDSNFTVTSAGSFGHDLDVRAFMKLCLAENDRRLGIYDGRLLRPMFVPRVVRALTAVLGLFALMPRRRRPAP